MYPTITTTKEAVKGITVDIDTTLEKRVPQRNLALDNTIAALYESPDNKLTAINGDIRHNNYLSYLIYAYRYHLGFVFSPDILWHIIISQVAKHIVDYKEVYREVFNGNSDGTKRDIKISISSFDVTDFCNKFIGKLSGEVFFDVSLFDGDFTTTTPEAKMNYMVALLESGSPFYNYIAAWVCGFTKVKLLGEVEDFNKILDKIEKLKVFSDVEDAFCKKIEDDENSSYEDRYKKIPNGHQGNHRLSKFLSDAKKITGEIIENYKNPNPTFWGAILRTDKDKFRDGPYKSVYRELRQPSSSYLNQTIRNGEKWEQREARKTKEQIELETQSDELTHDYIDGWITKLQLNFGTKLNTLNKRLISKMEFTIVDNPAHNGTYSLYSGIFSSNINDEDILVPEFGYFVNNYVAENPDNSGFDWAEGYE